jgi:hypothetical protein
LKKSVLIFAVAITAALSVNARASDADENPNDLNIDIIIDSEKTADEQCLDPVRPVVRWGNSFEDALRDMMAGHPAPTYPNPFTHIQNNYVFENNLTLIGDVDSVAVAPSKAPFDKTRPTNKQKYGKINCARLHRSVICPFDSAEKCRIWKSKPHIAITHTEPDRTISEESLCRIIDELRKNPHLPVESESGKTLIIAHRQLIETGRNCCFHTVQASLRQMGADDAAVQQWADDDRNIFHFTEKCLLWDEDDIRAQTNGDPVANVMIAAQQSCLSGTPSAGLRTLITPFMQLFNTAPELKDRALDYEFTNEAGMIERLSISDEVNIIAEKLK